MAFIKPIGALGMSRMILANRRRKAAGPTKQAPATPQNVPAKGNPLAARLGSGFGVGLGRRGGGGIAPAALTVARTLRARRARNRLKKAVRRPGRKLGY